MAHQPRHHRDEPEPAVERLSPDEAAAVRKRFAAGEGCKHCGGLHSRACPRVKRMTFQGDNLVEIEFWPDRMWSDDHVIWPEDAPTDDEPEAPAA